MKTVKSAAIYARISSDQTGEGLGVARQLEDCRRLAADRGWPVTTEYVDNDITASTRPASMSASIRTYSGRCLPL